MAAEEGDEIGQLHVIFFPLMGQGHMIPLFDIAGLFASRPGVKATVITTPANAPTFSKSSDNNVELEIVKFPSEEVGLPAGLENLSHLTETDHMNKFMSAVKLIVDGSLEELMSRLEPRPSCLVADWFMPSTADVAARLGIPWVGFNGGGYFCTSASDSLWRYRPQWEVETEDEEFVVTGLPGKVKMCRKKLAPAWANRNEFEENRPFMEMLKKAFETVEEKSFGVIFNTFYEMEADYADYYHNLIGTKCWSLGPVSLCYRSMEDKAMRGKQANIDVHECLYWLDSKPPNSVIYVCFGSIARMSSAQLTEIAMALEASNHHFIWVVNKVNNNEQEWLPSGFEARNQDNGLIIRGWAPQVMILDHVATGGFVTHCGWNSTLEGVSAGVPMVIWPVFAEQYMNEKLITEVLRVGVSVGAEQYSHWMASEKRVGRAEIEAAVRKVMAADDMKWRAMELKELAWKAVQEGGSSYDSLSELLKELRVVCKLDHNESFSKFNY